jgi:L-alanine-DL-glutamate epimerase-like enolase superfamily enzyme
MTRRLGISVETWPIAGSFTIARGSRTEAVVVVVILEEDGRRGRGECVPYTRYGETVESVCRQIESARAAVTEGCDRRTLLGVLPPGAARNALDCAIWDLEAKLSGVPAHVLAGIDRMAPVTTAYTISLGAPLEMAEAARRAEDRPVLKIKLGGGIDDRLRLKAVRDAVPDAALLVDANEGWSPDDVADRLSECADCGVLLVEQPLPAGRDAALAEIARPLPICADESVHVGGDLSGLLGRYDAVNVKLDKTGGLTEALATAAEAERLGLAVMVGCMVGTSLAMAPAMLLASKARFVDLDGPLLLAGDREHGLRYSGGAVFPPSPALWG